MLKDLSHCLQAACQSSLPKALHRRRGIQAEEQQETEGDIWQGGAGVQQGMSVLDDSDIGGGPDTAA